MTSTGVFGLNLHCLTADTAALSNIGDLVLRYVSTLVTTSPWTCSTKVPLPWTCLLRASYGYCGRGQYASHSGLIFTGVPAVTAVNNVKLMAMHVSNVFMCTVRGVSSMTVITKKR